MRILSQHRVMRFALLSLAPSLLELLCELLLYDYRKFLANNPQSGIFLTYSFRLWFLSLLALFLLSGARRTGTKLWSSAQRGAANFHLRAAQTVFGHLELIIPKRLYQEDLGDALEMIRQLVDQGRPCWQVYTKIVTSVLWVLLNAFREVASTFTRKSPSR